MASRKITIKVTVADESEKAFDEMLNKIAHFIINSSLGGFISCSIEELTDEEQATCKCQDPDQYFSRVMPMGYYCAKCGLEVGDS